VRVQRVRHKKGDPPRSRPPWAHACCVAVFIPPKMPGVGGVIVGDSSSCMPS